MRKGMLKRFLAGFLSFALVFMSVDSGCITAIAADLQENSLDLQHKTGLVDVKMVSITPEELDETSFYNYVKFDGTNYGSANYDNEWGKYSSYYYYNQLSDEYKETWDALNALCLSYLTSNIDAEYIQFQDGTDGYYTAQVAMPEGSTKEDLELFYDLFVMSNPQYYFVANGMIYATDFSSVGLQFYEAFALGAERATATENFKNEIEEAYSIINTSSTDEAVLRLAHDYIVNNVEYDNAIIADDNIDYDEEQAAYSQSAYSALCLGLTVCAGYSEAMQLLCNGVGVDTLCVTSNDHQWNKVRINDSWYNVDVTWGDSEYTDGTKVTWYKHYARNDEFYEADHTSHIVRSFWRDWMPLCTLDSIQGSYFTTPGTFPTVESTTVTPVIMAEKGTEGYTVTITSTTENATIYYTVDDTTPSAASSKSNIYTEPFTVEEGTVVKAIAVYNTYWDSAVVSKEINGIEDVEITISNIDEQTYSGSEIKPTFTVMANGVTLEEDKDYTVVYKDNINAGTATIEVTFIGDYDGVSKASTQFTIVPLHIADENSQVEITMLEEWAQEIVYTGKEIKIGVKITEGTIVLKEGVDYTLDYPDDCTNVGPVSVDITFIKNYTGGSAYAYDIIPKTLSELNVAVIQPQKYNGTGITPELTITDGDYTLVKDTDYTVVYENNVSITSEESKAEVIVTFCGNYDGIATATFDIVPRTLDDLTIKEIPEQEYSGEEIKPSLEITYGEETLVEETDYSLSYSDNTNAGTAIITITFKGDYIDLGTQNIEFTIAPKEVNKDNAIITGIESKVEYTGEEIVFDNIEISVNSVPLTSEEYEITYSDNKTDAGTVTYTITFKGNYSGTIIGEFEITRLKLEAEQLTFAEEDADGNIIPLVDENGNPITKFVYTYAREEIIPEVIVSCGELVFTKDGELSFEIDFAGADHTNAGTVEFTVVLKGNYEGELKGTLVINKKSSSELVIPNYESKNEYTGELVDPIKIFHKHNDKFMILEKGVDYTVTVTEDSESDGIEVGLVKVCISFIRNYEGEDIFKTYEITPIDITSNNVDVNETTGYISKITAGTTVETFIAMLNDNVSIKILNKDDTEVAKDALVGTGMQVCLMNGTDIAKTYTIIVTGDTNGDGKISITDMIAVKAHLLKKELLTGASEKAADVAGSTNGGDGKVSITDFIKVKAHLLKKETVTGVVVK